MKCKSFESGYQAFKRAYEKVNISTLSYFFGVIDDADERSVLMQRIREACGDVRLKKYIKEIGGKDEKNNN